MSNNKQTKKQISRKAAKVFRFSSAVDFGVIFRYAIRHFSSACHLDVYPQITHSTSYSHSISSKVKQQQNFTHRERDESFGQMKKCHSTGKLLKKFVFFLFFFSCWPYVFIQLQASFSFMNTVQSFEFSFFRYVCFILNVDSVLLEVLLTKVSSLNNYCHHLYASKQYKNCWGNGLRIREEA